MSGWVPFSQRCSLMNYMAGVPAFRGRGYELVRPDATITDKFSISLSGTLCTLNVFGNWPACAPICPLVPVPVSAWLGNDAPVIPFLKTSHKFMIARLWQKHSPETFAYFQKVWVNIFDDSYTWIGGADGPYIEGTIAGVLCPLLKQIPLDAVWSNTPIMILADGKQLLGIPFAAAAFWLKTLNSLGACG